VGQRIFASAPFLLGLIGCEQSGSEYAADLDAAGGPPEERWGGYLWREGSELRWYPPTLYGPPSTPDPRGHPT